MSVGIVYKIARPHDCQQIRIVTRILYSNDGSSFLFRLSRRRLLNPRERKSDSRFLYL